MLLWFLKQLPTGTIAGAVMLADALQLAGIDLVGMGSNLLFDLLGMPDWSDDWFGSLL